MLATAAFQQRNHIIRLQPTQARRIPTIQLCASQELRGLVIQPFFLHRPAARSMATATVAQPLHQIGAAVPLGALLTVWLIGLVFMEQRIPYR
ncbi:hypothetical protein D3C77_614750 [compost metagenome]